ncbi:MAG: class II fructose-bisphosphate aldolase [Candidatus Bathyarchaeota archaeon]|nr:MAG: class II fructose-bisphosphate aldolase [Candidatus Bathyarchaeota archaeon]
MFKPKDITPLTSGVNPYIRKIETSRGYTRFLNLKEILKPADDHNFGVLAANAVVPEMLYAALDAAFKINSPLIIEAAESQVGYALLGSGYKDKLTRFMDLVVNEVTERAKKYKKMPPLCMHIDHLQKDPDLAYVASKTGYTSVELDFSKQPTSDRAEAVQKNVSRCIPIIEDMHSLGISVEVEEGEIGSSQARSAQTRTEIEAEITRVEDAIMLVKGTNPEALAIFIGAAHGEIKGKPPIFYNRIGETREGLRQNGIDVPIVLHGGTGQTYEGFNAAVNQGARKFNYATRFWTILFQNLKQDKVGESILKEMASEAKKLGRSSRYVWAKFAKKLYNEISPQTFRTAQEEIYVHICELMEKAFLSKEKARHYSEKAI